MSEPVKSAKARAWECGDFSPRKTRKARKKEKERVKQSRSIKGEPDILSRTGRKDFSADSSFSCLSCVSWLTRKKCRERIASLLLLFGGEIDQGLGGGEQARPVLFDVIGRT